MMPPPQPEPESLPAAEASEAPDALDSLGAPDTHDALVIGAGPAGATAALLLARRGRRVLLVDRARFPRTKVCGGCINPAAINVLREIGLGDMLDRLHAPATRTLRLCTGKTSSTISLTGGAAVSRTVFDQAIVDEAVRAGAVFRDGCSATLAPADDGWHALRLGEGRGRVSGEIRHALRQTSGRATRIVHLQQGEHSTTIHANVVLACTGLDTRLLDDEPNLSVSIARRSHMGVGAIATDPADCSHYEPHIIHMASGKGGYVGLVRLEDGSLDIAAALSPAFVKKQRGPAGAVAAILAQAHQPAIRSIDQLDWLGTPLLTRRRKRVASHRLFVLGDAAGYVEPFTGEGIAWALASAQACAPIADQAIDAWQPALADAWNDSHRRLLGNRQRRCRWLTRVLRWRPAVSLANQLIRLVPALAQPFVRSIQRSWHSVAVARGPLPSGDLH